MDRYGYDTYDSQAYCIIDRKKNTHIATAFHVTTADKIVNALNALNALERRDTEVKTIVRGITHGQVE